MWRPRNLRRFTRGLRFRLTATYALFFAALLIGVAALFNQHLATALNEQAASRLDQEWAAMKAYLRIEPNRQNRRNEVYWYYDPEDVEESRTVLNIKRIYMVTDADGRVIPEYATQDPAISPYYAALAFESPAEIRAKVNSALAASKPNAEPMTFRTRRRGASGDEYLIRSGIVFDEPQPKTPKRAYYVALGTPLRPYQAILRQFTWVYAGVIPSAIILASLLGWVVAGRGLTPVRDVAQAAQRITGSNLSLRIPARDAGDELDYLILTFNRMIARLEASFQQVKRFSTDVSHELRTPITGMRGQLEVALFTATSEEQFREAIVNALQDIDRLSQIVRALLLLSQADSGQLALQKKRVDISELVRDVVEQFQIPAEGSRVRLTANLVPGCFAEADRVQIERLLTNLLSNAIKFTSPGGSVRVSTRQSGGDGGVSPKSIEIEVSDTGRGIAPEHLPHIFDRFYRVPGPGAAPTAEQGLGLGLSFVDWIVKAHDGTIKVESALGKGARFRIQLPSAAGMDAVSQLEPVL